MTQIIWLNVVASPLAAVAAGAVTFFIFRFFGSHRDEKGSIATGRLATAILLGIAVYTVLVLSIGQLFLHMPMADTVKKGFGEDRIAWVLAGVAIDGLLRLWVLFDSKGTTAAS